MEPAGLLLSFIFFSTFASPCQPAHDTNATINGFDSGFRPTENGTSGSILSVPIDDTNVNTPFWFFDASPGACGSGAVGVINSNESSLQTLDGFVVSLSSEIRRFISLSLRPILGTISRWLLVVLLSISTCQNRIEWKFAEFGFSGRPNS